MKSILDTAQHLFQFTDSDKIIYAEFFAEYQAQGLSENDSRLFANITFLLTNRSIIDNLLKKLDTSVKKLWDAENGNPDTTLELHNPKKYLSFVGLRWPAPTRELASNHSNHLLSRALLQIEQRHHINATYASSAPVPTFLGVITPEDAIKILVKNKRVWNDDPNMSGIFFHGKMMHRIQFCLMMLAIESGLLDPGKMTIADIIKKLIDTKIKAYEPFYDLGWNFLIDFNISDIHFTKADRRNLSALAAFFPANIDNNTYGKPYLFGCDPYFLHSYVMTASRKNTPYLSECVTQTFCKAALSIQEMEKELGVKVNFQGYIDNKDNRTPKTTRTKLTKNDLTMPNVLSRQAQTFATYGVHAIRYEDIMNKQKQTGKSARIDHKRSAASAATGYIQYRSIFTNTRKLEAQADINPRPSKLRK